MHRVFLAAVISVFASPVFAMNVISSESQFRDVVVGKTLSIFLYGLKLNVNSNGTITGRAVGQDVTGNWTWEGGYFCRGMKWGERDIPYNCQQVKYDGKSTVEFTTDKGAGDSAKFSLR